MKSRRFDPEGRTYQSKRTNLTRRFMRTKRLFTQLVKSLERTVEFFGTKVLI